MHRSNLCKTGAIGRNFHFPKLLFICLFFVFIFDPFAFSIILLKNCRDGRKFKLQFPGARASGYKN